MAIIHEHIGQLVALLPHVHVVAQLLHCGLQDVCQAGGIFCKIISYIRYCAIVVVDRRNVNVGVPGDYPLRVVVVDEDFVYVASKENLASLPGLLNDCSLIQEIGDGCVSANRGNLEHFLYSVPNVLFVLLWTLHFDVGYCAGFGFLLL